MQLIEEIEFNTVAGIGQTIPIRSRGVRGFELFITTNDAGAFALSADDGVVSTLLLAASPGGQNSGDSEYVRGACGSRDLILNWPGAGLKQATLRLYDEPLQKEGRVTLWSFRDGALGAGASTGDIGPDNWGGMVEHWELLVGSDQALAISFTPVVGSVWSGKYLLAAAMTAGSVFGTGAVPAVQGASFDFANPAGVPAVLEAAVVGYLR